MKALAEDYIKRAKLRLRVLPEFLKEVDYADVIRLCQEIVGLSQKAILIKLGINPPKWHDVIDVILENREKLPENIGNELTKLRKNSKWLRAQREISFYGAEDFIPSKDYTLQEAKKAMRTAEKFLKVAEDL